MNRAHRARWQRDADGSSTPAHTLDRTVFAADEERRAVREPRTGARRSQRTFLLRWQLLHARKSPNNVLDKEDDENGGDDDDGNDHDDTHNVNDDGLEIYQNFEISSIFM